MPSCCCGPRADDAASIQASLAPYMPQSQEASRPLSPAPSYHTIELGRNENVNEEQAVVPAQASRGSQSRPRSSTGRVLSKERDEVRITMLMAGIWYQKTALAILSVLSGAQVNAQCETGIAPIHCAALKGNITMIKILLMRAANIEIEEEHGLTPLDMAVMQGHTKAMKLLISRSQHRSPGGKESDPIVAQSLRRKLLAADLIETMSRKGMRSEAGSRKQFVLRWGSSLGR
ncbi:hypothetical protein N7G274_005172 [Stereocaulon virgatum]|uniref:Uncharacterized protein n=1 Tax=Stereocaulon virgatum TaxID=373712 RepID=A0ABR4A7V3_9LECA